MTTENGEIYTAIKRTTIDFEFIESTEEITLDETIVNTSPELPTNSDVVCFENDNKEIAND